MVAVHDVEILLAEGYNQFQDFPGFDKVVNGVSQGLFLQINSGGLDQYFDVSQIKAK